VQLDPDTFYVACVIADGRHHWSSPMQGRHCSSANVTRTTVEAIGRFLGGLCFYDVNVADAIEVYALPAEPTLTLAPIVGRRLPDNDRVSRLTRSTQHRRHR
jgi:hypothetical protein